MYISLHKKYSIEVEETEDFLENAVNLYKSLFDNLCSGTLEELKRIIDDKEFMHEYENYLLNRK